MAIASGASKAGGGVGAAGSAGGGGNLGGGGRGGGYIPGGAAGGLSDILGRLNADYATVGPGGYYGPTGGALGVPDFRGTAAKSLLGFLTKGPVIGTFDLLRNIYNYETSLPGWARGNALVTTPFSDREAAALYGFASHGGAGSNPQTMATILGGNAGASMPQQSANMLIPSIGGGMQNPYGGFYGNIYGR